MKDQDSGGGSERNCSFHASCDHMPPGPKRFKVTGKCKFPTAGYSVELKPTRGGINPDIYFLEKIVHAPSGMVPQVETWVDVKPYEITTDKEYVRVQIRPEDYIMDVKHLE